MRETARAGHAGRGGGGSGVSLTLLGIGPSQAHQALPPGIVAKIPRAMGASTCGRQAWSSRAAACSSRRPSAATGGPAPAAIRRQQLHLDVPYINSAAGGRPAVRRGVQPGAERTWRYPACCGQGADLRESGRVRPPLRAAQRAHTLALGLSRVPDRVGAFDPSPLPPGTPAARPIFPLAACAGLAGDGSPGDGSLRNFAVGAVVQHFPKTLNRVEGRDFRLPTGDELDAMEAFQLSLGRQAEMNLDPNGARSLRFADCPVAQGQNLFFNGAPSQGWLRRRTCSGCHTQAGAGTPNRNRATGRSGSPLAPACLSPWSRTATAASARAPACRSAGDRQRQTRRTSTRARW